MEKTKKHVSMKNVYVLAVMGMLIALQIVLERMVPAINSEYLKLGFGFAPALFAAIFLGPVEAAIVYALGDLIGALILPFGPYHPGFTVCAAAMGFLFGLFLNKKPLEIFKCDLEWKKIRFFPNMLVPVLINNLVLGLVVNTLWISQLYGSKTYFGYLASRVVQYAILVPVQLALIPVMMKLSEQLKKTSVFGSRASRRVDEKLGSISRKISIPGLSRVSELLSLIGDPQDKLRVIHVAGTNGKGSFVAMLSSVLKAAGYTVGSFSSPAITGVTDGFRINGEEISAEELESLLGEIEPHSLSMQDKPTEFEVLTAAAYLLFEKRGCDFAVVECGMGGALDATNVLSSPLLSVITNIQLDHCSYLGGTVAEIAAHKAGIIKEGRPVLFGGSDEEAYSVIAKAAEEKGSALFRTDLGAINTISADLSGTSFSYADMGSYSISLLGSYQPENAANVLEAVRILRNEGVDISEDALRRGLKEASWHGRFEILSKRPIVIFDGSHNPEGVAHAAQSIKHYFPDKKVVLLMGVMADKDYGRYPELLAPVAEKLYAVCPDNPRALSAEKLAECFAEKGVSACSYEDLNEGAEAAYGYAKQADLPLVALGTLYMYSQITSALPCASGRSQQA